MAKLDTIHDAVKNTLINDNWTIRQKAVQLIVERYQLALVIVNLEREEVATWIR
jgi:hypothetical protein